MKIGEILNKENYTQGAIWCNRHNAHIENIDGQYIIVQDSLDADQTLEKEVRYLEQNYGMCRWAREGILAEGSLYSAYTKAKAREIETLAEKLRKEKA